MIDLTPLDVRKKRGDFKKSLRGYDPLEVDGFLELVAERMEELVKANLTLEERAQRLGEQVVSLGGRERAVNEALVTAQQLRDEIRGQAQHEAEQIRKEADREVSQLRKEAERDAEHLAREARLEAKGLVADAERLLEERRTALSEMEGQRLRFLESYRHLLQRQMELVQVEENRSPLDEVAVELDLGGGRHHDVDEAYDLDHHGEVEAAATPEAPDVRATPRADVATEAIEVAEVAEVAAVAAGDDDDDAVPVEGLAPSVDDLGDDATILPHPGATIHSLARQAAAQAGGEGVPTLQKLLEEMGEGEAREG